MIKNLFFEFLATLGEFQLAFLMRWRIKDVNLTICDKLANMVSPQRIDWNADKTIEAMTS